MTTYVLLIRENVRKAFHKGDVSLDEAKNFLRTHPHGVVRDVDGNLFTTIEELEEYVTDIGSFDRTECDNSTSSGESVSESTDSKLFEFNRNNTE